MASGNKYSRVDMEEWQTGIWVENCEKFNYPHYCNKARLAQLKEPIDEKQDVEKGNVCNECHKEHTYPDAKCGIV